VLLVMWQDLHTQNGLPEEATDASIARFFRCLAPESLRIGKVLTVLALLTCASLLKPKPVQTTPCGDCAKRVAPVLA